MEGKLSKNNFEILAEFALQNPSFSVRRAEERTPEPQPRMGQRSRQAQEQIAHVEVKDQQHIKIDRRSASPPDLYYSAGCPRKWSDCGRRPA